MPIDLDLNQGSIIKLPTGLYRFCEERPNKILLLQREGTGLDLPMPEHRLIELLGNGKAELIDFMSSGEDEAPGPNDNADFGPDEEWAEKEELAAAKDAEPKVLSPEVRRARALQFYVRKWDEDGRGRLGRKGLQKLIDQWRPVAIQKGYEPKKDEQGFRVHPTRLMHAIRHCGKPGERPLRVFRSRRGRNQRKHFDPFVEDALDRAVNYYWKARSCDYNDAYAHFRTLMREENERRAKDGMPKLEKFPKRLETLRRRITAETNYTNWARKYSKHEAYRKFKGTKDALMATKPLEMVIMDHTKLDTWTVLDTETGLPLGRPWLTMAIDVATRMPLGYLVSFEPASLYSVLTTLKRVNKNKSYVKREFPGIKGTWSGWGRPLTILVDHGWEFTSPSFQDALHDLGTDIIWAPVHTPQYKAIGERFFGTLNTMLFHKLPGAVPYPVNVMRQVKLNPKAEAMITLADLDETIHQAIIEVYQNERHTGLGAIPARIWRDKIRLHRRPFIRDIKALNALLGRIDTATLTRAGVTFKNMQFHEDSVSGDMLNELVRHEDKRSQADEGSGSVKVKVKWNAIDASSIEVWHHGGTPRPHYVTLRNKDMDFFANLSFWHWEKIQEFAKEADLDFRDEDERWDARDRLYKKWKAYTDKMPLRETRDARRGLAYSQGTFDDKTTNDDADLSAEDILYGEAEPSRDGMAEATLVPDVVPAFDRQDDGTPPKGRPDTERMKKKRKRTNERNKKAEAAEKEATAERKRKREAAQKSAGEKSQPEEDVVFTDDSASDGDDGWGDEKTSAATGAEGEEDSTTDGETFDDLDKSEGFDDDSTE